MMTDGQLIRAICWLGIGMIAASPIAAFWSFWSSLLSLVIGIAMVIFADENWPQS